MQIAETKGQFGFHFSAGDDECRPTVAFVQIYVKSSALSRAADLAVSPNLMTAAEIDFLSTMRSLPWRPSGTTQKVRWRWRCRAGDFEREAIVL